MPIRNGTSLRGRKDTSKKRDQPERDEPAAKRDKQR